jgi:hypothetical protein
MKSAYIYFEIKVRAMVRRVFHLDLSIFWSKLLVNQVIAGISSDSKHLPNSNTEDVFLFLPPPMAFHFGTSSP